VIIRSLRARLTFVFSALFGCLLVLAMGLLYARVTKSLHREFRDEMTHDARLLAEIFKEELKLDELEEFQAEIKEFDIEVLILDSHDKPVVKSAGWQDTGFQTDKNLLARIQQAPVYRSHIYQKETYALLSRLIHIPNVGVYSLHIARSQRALLGINSKLLQWMSIIVPFMLLLGAAGGYWFSARALNPVEKIRKNAQDISARNLNTRLPVPVVKDELYFLTTTLNQMLARLQDSYDRLKNFTADASHELRIPLTSLRGHVEVALRKDRSVDEYKTVLTNTLEEAENLSRLTQNLLLLAQADAKKIPLNKQSVDLEPFMNNIRALTDELKNEKNIVIKMNSSLKESAVFDPDQITRLLLILIDNALKYGRENGSVTIVAKNENSRHQWVVTDDGIGIPTEEVGKIFDRFYRVDKTRSREMGGIGLGLSIAHEIAEAHGGHLQADSRLGEGTTITLTLPA
jgi:heavy metal sensor kinase